jgi:hypothetical protein
VRNDFLDSILVVNFDRNYKSARNITSSNSSRCSSRAFERAYRGRAFIGSQVSKKADAQNFSGIIGTGTGFRSKEQNLAKQSHEDPVQVYDLEDSHTVPVNLDDLYSFTSPNSKTRRTQTVRNNVDKFQIEQVFF